MEQKVNSGDLRLGRIGKKMERMLGIALTSDQRLYLSEKALDNLSQRYPEKHLAILSSFSYALRHVDRAFYLEQLDMIKVLAHYEKGRGKRCEMLFVHQGRPKRWYLAKVDFTRKDHK